MTFTQLLRTIEKEVPKTDNLEGKLKKAICTGMKSGLIICDKGVYKIKTK